MLAILFQVVAQAVLFMCMNTAGIFISYLSDRAQRQAFLETRRCVEARLRLETENQRQVMAANALRPGCLLASFWATRSCYSLQTQPDLQVFSQSLRHGVPESEIVPLDIQRGSVLFSTLQQLLPTRNNMILGTKVIFWCFGLRSMFVNKAMVPKKTLKKSHLWPSFFWNCKFSFRINFF